MKIQHCSSKSSRPSPIQVEQSKKVYHQFPKLLISRYNTTNDISHYQFRKGPLNGLKKLNPYTVPRPRPSTVDGSESLQPFSIFSCLPSSRNLGNKINFKKYSVDLSPICPKCVESQVILSNAHETASKIFTFLNMKFNFRTECNTKDLNTKLNKIFELIKKLPDKFPLTKGRNLNSKPPRPLQLNTSITPKPDHPKITNKRFEKENLPCNNLKKKMSAFNEEDSDCSPSKLINPNPRPNFEELTKKNNEFVEKLRDRISIGKDKKDELRSDPFERCERKPLKKNIPKNPKSASNLKNENILMCKRNVSKNEVDTNLKRFISQKPVMKGIFRKDSLINDFKKSSRNLSKPSKINKNKSVHCAKE